MCSSARRKVPSMMLPQPRHSASILRIQLTHQAYARHVYQYLGRVVDVM